MLNCDEIKQLLPHRYPMLLIDRVVGIEPGSSLTALKAVTVNEPWYASLPDDAAGQHDYPSVLVLESWCQAAAVLGLLDRPHPDGGGAEVVLAVRFQDVTFHVAVLPGDVLEHRVRLVQACDDALLFTGEALVGDEPVLGVGSVMLVVRPVEGLVPPCTPISRPPRG